MWNSGADATGEPGGRSASRRPLRGGFADLDPLRPPGKLACKRSRAGRAGVRFWDGFLRVLIPLVIVGVAMTIQQRTWVEHPERVAVGAGVALGMAILVGA